MKFKGFLLIGFGVLAVAIAFGFVNFYTLPQTSAEEFTKGFQSRSFETIFDDADMSGVYNFNKAHSFINFKVKHMGLIEVPGFFRDFTGTVNYNAKDVSKSTVEFKAMATSVDTGVSARDNHLRSKDFFEVETFPELTFKSTKVEKKGKQWMVTGDFTMKGVTKPISFPFDVAGILPQKDGAKMGITADTSINRRDFGVSYGSNMPNGVAVLSDDVKVSLQIEADMKKEMPAMDKK
jgi:polyisoprenoid-binding protein YceI